MSKYINLVMGQNNFSELGSVKAHLLVLKNHFERHLKTRRFSLTVANGMKLNPKSIQKLVPEALTEELPLIFSATVQSSDLSTLSWALVLFRLPHKVLFGLVNRGKVTVTGDAMHPISAKTSALRLKMPSFWHSRLGARFSVATEKKFPEL